MPREHTALELRWLHDLEAAGKSPHTRKQYASALRALSAGAGGVLPELFTDVHARTMQRARWSVPTQRLRLAVLQGFCAWLVAHGHRPTPLTIERPPRPDTEPRPFTYGTKNSEIEKLRRVADTTRDLEWQSYFYLLDATGCRVYEPIDLDCADIPVFGSRRSRDELRVFFRSTKTGAFSSPVYDIASHGRPAARLLGDILRRYQRATRIDLRGPLFPARGGTRRTHRWVESRWVMHQEAAAVDGTLSQLRHTFACEELQRTGDLERVSKWLHHSDVQTTQIYARYAGL